MRTDKRCQATIRVGQPSLVIVCTDNLGHHTIASHQVVRHRNIQHGLQWTDASPGAGQEPSEEEE